MKLGEALVRRSDVQTRIGQLHSRLRAAAVTQEGDQPPEAPTALLAELDALVAELERLVVAINLTNTAVRLPAGQTLTAALARRDVLAVHGSALGTVVEAASEGQARYSRSEVRIVRHVDVAAVRQRIDHLARERRELDAAIQERNWTEELLES